MELKKLIIEKTGIPYLIHEFYIVGKKEVRSIHSNGSHAVVIKNDGTMININLKHPDLLKVEETSCN